MDEYLIGTVEPPHCEVEHLLCQVVLSLADAQLEYRCSNMSPPPPPPSSDEPDEAELDRWQEEVFEHRRRNPDPDPPAPLSLSDLWSRVAFPSLAMRVARHDDLFFDQFAISQRYLSDHPEWPCYYYVAIPTGPSSFRCIATESSGRLFYTAQQHRRCSPPDKNDFGIVRVRSSGAAQIMRIYLPSRYGKWMLVKDQLGYVESILGENKGET